MEAHLLSVNIDPNVVSSGNASVVLNGTTLALSALFSDNFKINQLPIRKVSLENDEGTDMVRTPDDEHRILTTNILPTTRVCSGENIICPPAERSVPENLPDLPEITIETSNVKHGSKESCVGETEKSTLLQELDSQFEAGSDKTLPNGAHLSAKALLDGEKSGDAEAQEPKKRKGGWPKGKKRRKEISTTQAPKAPSTGYVLFLNERRKMIKDVHPELPLAEIMKILGNEWSHLPTEEKQSYLGRAAEDKKRYSEELKIYQQSEAYQTYLKRKRLKGTYNVQLPIADVPSEDGPSITIQDIEGEDVNDLYCKVCNLFFVSVHNKREHLYGRQHLQALTGEIHKEAIELSGASVCSEDESWSNSEGISECSRNSDKIKCNYLCPPSLRNRGATNINQSIIDFINLNYARENEIKLLRDRLEEIQKKNKLLQKELQELKEKEEKTKQTRQDLKEYGKSLSSQLVNLRMVPTLFGVINF